jgi:Na+/pantothenate symporter
VRTSALLPPRSHIGGFGIAYRFGLGLDLLLIRRLPLGHGAAVRVELLESARA